MNEIDIHVGCFLKFGLEILEVAPALLPEYDSKKTRRGTFCATSMIVCSNCQLLQQQR